MISIKLSTIYYKKNKQEIEQTERKRIGFK